jgi:hypothetical protein
LLGSTLLASLKLPLDLLSLNLGVLLRVRGTFVEYRYGDSNPGFRTENPAS